jgi:hypothetical protein
MRLLDTQIYAARGAVRYQLTQWQVAFLEPSVDQEILLPNSKDYLVIGFYSGPVKASLDLRLLASCYGICTISRPF